MKIDNELEIFKFAHFINTMYCNDLGTDLLVSHFDKTGKIVLLQMLVNNYNPKVKFSEIQYLIAAENYCERLYSLLDNLIRVPYVSSEEKANMDFDVDVIANSNEVINQLKRLKILKFRNDWCYFLESLSEIVIKLENAINRLIGSKKTFHFCSNAKTQDVFLGKVNYDYKDNVYFLFQYRMK